MIRGQLTDERTRRNAVWMATQRGVGLADVARAVGADRRAVAKWCRADGWRNVAGPGVEAVWSKEGS